MPTALLAPLLGSSQCRLELSEFLRSITQTQTDGFALDASLLQEFPHLSRFREII